MLCFFAEQIDAEALNARHGCDGFTTIAAIKNKYGVDKVGWANDIFLHQFSRKIMTAHTTHTGSIRAVARVGPIHII